MPSHHGIFDRLISCHGTRTGARNTGSRFSTSCTIMARPSNPRRMSVAPHTTQICVPAGIAIIARTLPTHPPAAPRAGAETAEMNGLDPEAFLRDRVGSLGS